MCLATAAIVVGAVGTVVGGAGTIMAGQQAAAAQKQAAAYNAQVAENNRKIAQQNEEYAIRAGMAKAEKESLRGRVAMGKIKTAQAASGIDSSFGSAVDVQTGAREANVLDVSNVLQDAQLQASGYRSQASNFDAQKGLYELQGRNVSSTGSTLSGLGTMLSGAGSLGSKWAGMQGANDPYSGWTAGNSLGSATYEKAWGE